MRKTAFLSVLVLLLALLCSCTSAEPAVTEPKTGWQDKSYLQNGEAVVGWQEIDGVTYYFDKDGVLASGWIEDNGSRYYLKEDGTATVGWLDLDDKRYYFTAEGTLHTGFLEEEGVTYYFKDDGSMARGTVVIDGVNHFFTSSGASIVMVNPQNYIPEGYTPDLVDINNTKLAYSGMKVDRSCYDALVRMMNDCNEKSGARVYIVSAYRTMERQTQNYNKKVNYWKERGYSTENAKKKAATSVAIPGTSENQLGLALDIVDTRSWVLNGNQEDFEGQQWLMEHCYEYGFILRYPEDKLDITGIIYEPWHYRYVGEEVAAEIRDSGLTLEEYLASLS